MTPSRPYVLLRSSRLAHRAGRHTILAGILAFALVQVASLWAQTSGTIVGRVLDQTGQPTAGVELSVRGPSLQGRELSSNSDEEGRYRLAPLPPGTYTLSTKVEGSTSQHQEQVTVGLGAVVTLDLVLPAVRVEERIEVSAERALIEVDRSELATPIDPDAVQMLPLEGREIENLVRLAPGVTPRPGEVRDQRVSVFGERPAATAFFVDSGDNTDPVDGGPLERLNQDAIQELRIITTGYRAEVGGAQGGLVRVLTRSGTDQPHGRAFYVRRDEGLDESNVSGQEPPQLARDQWGLSLGGALRRDRLYYFLSGESLDESRGRNLDLSTVPSWLLAGLATPQGNEDLNAGPQVQSLSVLGKLDFLPTNARHRLDLVFNHGEDEAAGEIPAGIAGSLVLPSAGRSRDHETRSLTLRHTWTRSSHGLLETTARVADGRTDDNLDRSQRPEAVLLLLQSGFLQTAAPLGGRRRDLERRQLSQTYSHLSGEHELKLGFDLLHTRLEGFDLVFNDVEYSAAFLDPNAATVLGERFQRLGFAQSAARFFTLPSEPGGDLVLDLENTDSGLFVQDTWRLGRHTLDLGLRYDRSSLFDDDEDNFAPRVGWAWDVGGKRSTVVKASGGLFFDRNALAAAAGVPEKGGIFTRSAFDVALPRLGADYTDSLIDLVITSGFQSFGVPPENPAYLDFANALRADPLAIYNLLGIAVDDPSVPPIVTADNVQGLSGLSPEAVLQLLESTFPGTDWEFFDVPGGSLVGDRVLSFFPRGPLNQSRDISLFSEDRTPSTWAFTFGLEQRLGDLAPGWLGKGLGQWTAAATYVRRRTRDLLTRRITNLFDVPPGDPNFGQTTDGGPRISQVTYDGQIDYQGFTFSLHRPFSGRYSLRLAYTYSDAEDNLLTGEVGSGFSNNNRPDLDLGPSNLAVPHVGLLSGVVSLPWDLRLGANLFWRSGLAFSPRGIIDTDGDGLVDQRDLSQPRNAFRAPSYLSLDVRLEKTFDLGGPELTLQVDAFNLSNEDNVSGVNAVSGADFGTANSFFPGREIQIGARLALGGS